jgi:hypothetical protein
MRVHVDVLGSLYTLGGIFALLVGVSLGVLAFGTNAAVVSLTVRIVPTDPVVWLLIAAGVVCLVTGVLMMATGRAIRRRSRLGRAAALVAGTLNLAVVPFGTALGIYTFWVLMNDEGRQQFYTIES